MLKDFLFLKIFISEKGLRLHRKLIMLAKIESFLEIKNIILLST